MRKAPLKWCGNCAFAVSDVGRRGPLEGKLLLYRDFSPGDDDGLRNEQKNVKV